MYNKIHFAEFKKLRSNRETWAGHNEHRWATDIGAHECLAELTNNPRDRASMRTFCLNSRVSLEARMIACMAWRGKSRKDGRTMWCDRAKRKPIVQSIIAGKIDRKEAYGQFRTAKIKGLGPAFFTKAIYFLSPETDPLCRGFIMDQWTGKSIDLIFLRPIIKFDLDYVSRRNTADIYEEFCRSIVAVSRRISPKKPNPDQSEMELFSNGRRRGQQPGRWRSYVKTHWIRRN